VTRPRGQSLGGRYRSQPRDPLTGRRLNVAGRSLAEIENRLSRIDHVRDGLRYGDISAVEAQGKLRPAVGMRLEVRPLVERFIRGVPPASEGPARGAWKNLLEPWFGDCVVWDLTDARLRAWRTDLERARRPKGKRGYAKKYVRYAWDLLKGSVRLAMRDGLVSEFPWGEFYVRNPKRPDKPRELARDPAEMLRILVAAKEADELGAPPGASRLVVLATMFLTGLRQAEAAGLSWSDVDFERGVIHVRRQARRGWQKQGSARPELPPKGGPANHVMHPDVERALRFQRSELEKLRVFRPDGPVFPNPKKGTWRTSGRVMAPAAFRALVRKAGLPDVESWVVHSTRHTFSRLEMLGHGGDLTTVAERTRHADLDVLQGSYLRLPARDAGGSKIPELPPGLGVPAIEMGPVAPLLESGPMSEPAEIPALPPTDFFHLARVHIARGEPARRPAEVTRRIKAAYSRAYNEALRATGGDPGAAREQAYLARRGALGAWARAVSVARKETENA